MSEVPYTMMEEGALSVTMEEEVMLYWTLSLVSQLTK